MRHELPSSIDYNSITMAIKSQLYKRRANSALYRFRDLQYTPSKRVSKDINHISGFEDGRFHFKQFFELSNLFREIRPA